MLVRAAFNRSPGLPKPYDEAEASRHPDTQEVEWREMLVVWRRLPGKDDRVELYQDYVSSSFEVLDVYMSEAGVTLDYAWQGADYWA